MALNIDETSMQIFT